ncbi:hypothetical protein HYR99_30650, partial [Candidatus Poribacteria bacterium]|nr:hypothetical protein [Candidatus Poribacteria bacterium]
LQHQEDSTIRFIPAYIDLQGVAEDDFFATIAAGVVEHAAGLFREALALRLNEARDGYTYRDLTRDLRTVIDHLKEGETKAIKIVLLMDEVDTLNTYSLRTNLNLRGLFMGPLKENLVLVMSGLYLKMDWSAEGGGSPPFNFLSREIQIQPLDEDSAAEADYRAGQRVLLLRAESDRSDHLSERVASVHDSGVLPAGGQSGSGRRADEDHP